MSTSRYFFVDEAGNPEIFAQRGRVIVGTPGSSRFFILGFLDVDDPKELGREIEVLRRNLINDRYFRHVPSMQPRARKTAIMFHAKDDVPEVRHKMYELLASKTSIRFVAVVKDKKKVLEYAVSRKKADTAYKYDPNELYDHLTRRIFKNNLHLAATYNICFAIRGNKPRTKALGECLQIAQQRFMEEHNITEASALNILPEYSKNQPCLQAADYFLWALQRLYENREERYFDYMKHLFKLVIDIDDTRRNVYGEYFDSKTNPLNLKSINPL